AGANKLIEIFQDIDSVLQIMSFSKPVPDDDIERLIEERNRARAEKNWHLADRIRDELRVRGVAVQDLKK
ncbi:MAG TPA: hypothetical protein VLP30_05135, partial [Desulfatirhabdiaceae bacterium]|nr:hypothetical protein [Desulfatirhabdiaceae bacterium]